MVVKYGRANVDYGQFHRQIFHDINTDRGQPEKRYTNKDATSSLIYADYLEENGMPHAAAFVRQVAGQLGGTIGRFPDSTAVMEYGNGTRDHVTRPLTVFAYQGLGAYQERRRGRPAPEPTVDVSLRSPHPDDPTRMLAFHINVPPAEAHEWMKRLVGEGHPPGNEERSSALRRAVEDARRENPPPAEPTALSRRRVVT